MQANEAFQPQGSCVVIAGAGVPGAAPVQIGGPSAGLIQVYTINVDATNEAFLVWGATAAACAANAAVLPSPGNPQVNTFPLQAAAKVGTTLTLAPGQFYTVTSAAGTPSVRLVVGSGKL